MLPIHTPLNQQLLIIYYKNSLARNTHRIVTVLLENNYYESNM